MTGRFAALDFETADYGRDSACALSVVIVDNDRVVDTLKHHDAASDALACAHIVLQARAKGNSHEELLQRHSLKPARKRN